MIQQERKQSTATSYESYDEWKRTRKQVYEQVFKELKYESAAYKMGSFKAEMTFPERERHNTAAGNKTNTKVEGEDKWIYKIKNSMIFGRVIIICISLIAVCFFITLYEQENEGLVYYT